ncbi:hypothetical protein H634G_11662, partial [Metarhizium anisopliae BRIP 53293]
VRLHLHDNTFYQVADTNHNINSGPVTVHLRGINATLYDDGQGSDADRHSSRPGSEC